MDRTKVQQLARKLISINPTSASNQELDAIKGWFQFAMQEGILYPTLEEMSDEVSDEAMSRFDALAQESAEERRITVEGKVISSKILCIPVVIEVNGPPAARMNKNSFLKIPNPHDLAESLVKNGCVHSGSTVVISDQLFSYRDMAAMSQVDLFNLHEQILQADRTKSTLSIKRDKDLSFALGGMNYITIRFVVGVVTHPERDAGAILETEETHPLESPITRNIMLQLYEDVDIQYMSVSAANPSWVLESMLDSEYVLIHSVLRAVSNRIRAKNGHIKSAEASFDEPNDNFVASIHWSQDKDPVEVEEYHREDCHVDLPFPCSMATDVDPLEMVGVMNEIMKKHGLIGQRRMLS